MTPAVYQRAGVVGLGEASATPTDLPRNATFNVPCGCVYGHDRTVRYVWQGCYRHGHTDIVRQAAAAVRSGDLTLAYSLCRQAA